MLRLGTLLLLVATTQAVNFACTTDVIQPATLGGNLPPLATQPVTVPKGTNCTYRFNIPDGYALKLSLNATLTSQNDTVSVVDNLNKVYSLIHGGAPIVGATIWVSANSASIRVIGTTGNSSFSAQYTYQKLDSYIQTVVNTGNYFPLRVVKGNSFYTITSANKEKVIATVGKTTSTSTDPALSFIYVYDGNNLTTAKMIGRLSELNMNASSGNSLSFVNFYNSVSTSYMLGNDASAVSQLSRYMVIITSLGGNVKANLADSSVKGAAYTFICLDCTNFYVTQLDFDSMSTIANLGYVTFRGMSPTHGMEKLINYTAMTLSTSQMPQKIPTFMFTMNLYMSKVQVVTSTINDDTVWKTPFDGRQGYIFSPNLWNPSTTNIAYNEEFRNDNQLYHYQLNMTRLGFKASSDSLRVRIGSGSGTPTLDNTYPKVSSSTGSVSSNGNYMKVDFSGSAGSDVRVAFQMTIASSASAISLLVSLALTLFYLF